MDAGLRLWSSEIGDLRIGRGVDPDDRVVVLNVEIIGRSLGAD